MRAGRAPVALPASRRETHRLTVRRRPPIPQEAGRNHRFPVTRDNRAYSPGRYSFMAGTQTGWLTFPARMQSTLPR